MRTGVAHLPLHGGKAPPWLFKRMVKLMREISLYVVSEYGPEAFVARFSHPVWFQSLGCVLGFDWHSSGVTTTTCGALKESLRGLENELGVYICGGKGGTSRKTPAEIEAKVATVEEAERLIKTSKLTAKVDNTALQDGYQLYHHCFLFTQTGLWAVVQQGMNPQKRYARRYHWLSKTTSDLVNEPHTGVCCDMAGKPLNLVARKSSQSRTMITQIAREQPEKLLKEWHKLTLLDLPRRHEIYHADLNPKYLAGVLLSTYQNQAQDFESLLLTKGLGPKSLRALTLLAEVLTGAKPSFEDPVRYSFAHGGKDGIPYPVDRKVYDDSIEILGQAIRQAKLGRSDKVNAYQKLGLLSRLRE